MNRELNDAAKTVPDGDCAWCFQSAAGPHKKATVRIWSVEWSQFINCCQRHAEAIQECNDNHRGGNNAVS